MTRKGLNRMKLVVLTRNESQDARSAQMARIRARDTKPEMRVRRALHSVGLRYRLHRNIVAHDVELGADNLHLLDGVTFAFMSLDTGEAKRLIVEKLEATGAAFVDVGMGLELDDGSLGGILRVTASTPEKRDHARQRISFVGGGAKDIYASNIQVADLNALNAVLAVVKWKKIRGFYRDLEGEHHFTYTTDGNMLINGDLG